MPLFYAEVDNSQANTGQINQRTLIIGQITSAGTAVPNVPIISQGVSDAATVGGQDSLLALQTATYRQGDTFGELWYLPLADDPAAQAATGTLTFLTPATVNGTVYLYVGGVRYALPASTLQTTTQLAAALAAIINADQTCPVNATATAGAVTFTAVNKGPTGNDIDLRLNFQGSRGGEVLPAGLTTAIVQMSGGATAPSLTLGLSNLNSQAFDFIVCPYTDVTSLDAIKAFLNDVSGRWAWSLQLYGHAFAVYKGTFGAQVTLGSARNDQHMSIMGVYDSPTPTWLWSAALVAAAAVSLRIDPALPVQTLALQGVLAPPLQSRYQLTDQNTLLYNGISTFNVADDGTVSIQNLITTYQKNAFGNADNSYLEVETLFTLAYVLRALKTMVTSKYARVKLAADGTRFNAGSAIVTPNIIRADLIAKYRELEGDGYVQNGDAFKANLIVQKNTQNPNRVDVLFPGTLINQLRIFALLNQFRLQ
ncbi:MAG: phage tail sheath subtilisin-like domain-containing protein [Janthinobacterium lividum]